MLLMRLIRNFGTFVLRNPGRRQPSYVQDPWKAIPVSLDNWISHISSAHPPTPSPMTPRAMQSMWAASDHELILFEVDAEHCDNLPDNWSRYKLDSRIGSPDNTIWGVLGCMKDYRE